MEKNKKNTKITKTAILIGVIVVLVWALSGFLIDYWWGADERGTIGDMFGVINALFSGLAFVGLIITLLYQKEELSLQRNELSQTREELENQRKEFEEQNITLKQQRFDSTFFNMLTLQREIIKDIEYFNNPVDINGRRVFWYLYTNNLRGGITNKGVEVYNSLNYVHLFDHYFRYLLHILKSIDKTNFTYEDRFQYVSILEAQMSKYELLFTFYYGLSTEGEVELKPLIEKYALLKNCNSSDLVDTSHKLYYEITAFKINDTKYSQS